MRPLLAILAIAATAAMSQADQINFRTKPDIYGDFIVFTCEGDLWIGSIMDHSARRLTNHPGTETYARFSPKGDFIAFTANYDGGSDVYVMASSGGAPKRLTYDPGSAQVQSWTPDGQYVVYRSRKDNPPSGDNRLYKVPMNGGLSTVLPVPQGEFGDIGENGELAYVPVSAEWMNWFHYQGGAADDIWLADLGDKKFRRLTTSTNIDTTPVWSGNDVYYVSQSRGTSNLFKLDPSSGNSKEATQFSLPVRYPGADGERIVFELGPGLGIYDPKTNKSEQLYIDLNSDFLHVREQRLPLAPEVTRTTIGPTGKRILVEARGQIWSVAAENGDARVLENKPGARSMNSAWSPDGKTVAFLSDRSSEYQVWTVSATGGEPTKLTTTMKGVYSPLVWSPDGNWLATTERSTAIILINAKTGETKQLGVSPSYVSYDSFFPDVVFSPDSKLVAYSRLEDNWNASIWVYDIAANKNVQVSDINVNCNEPAFTADGKYLAFLSDVDLRTAYISASKNYGVDNITRVTLATLSPEVPSPFLPKNDEEGAPAEAKKDAPKITPSVDGIAFRTIDVPLPSARYSRIVSAGNKIFLLDRTTSAIGGGAATTQLIAYDLDKAKATTLNADVSDLEVSADGKKLLIVRGSTSSIVDATTGPFGGSDGVVSLSGYSLTVQPREEWKQVLREAGRIARDFFYDPNMHGVDWNAVAQDYESRLPLVGDRTDLTRLLKDMVSELNIGHAYINDATPGARRTPMGYLGAEFEPVPGADAVKVKRILRGGPFHLRSRSPLLEPGVNVREGDYIVSIAGQPVQKDQDIQALLIGTPGQVVAIGVNSQPTLVGARIVRVKPISSEGELRYSDWVEGRREYIRKHVGENIGYVHIGNMGFAGLTSFAQGHYPNLYKDGIVYDTRDNGGGWISSLILKDIAAKQIFQWQPRHGAPWAREEWAPIGHKVAICNENNFSDGELFIETWKKLKVGPVVGKRTAGGEVGSGGGYRLIDGGTIFVPNYGAYNAEGEWIIEGKGAMPDIVVEQDPNAVMDGKDPQLDKALELLTGMIKKYPPKRPAHPPFPNKVYKAKG